MKYTKTTIKELTKRYAIVLKKCAFLNMIALTGTFFATSAMAVNAPLGVVANDTVLSGTYEDYVNTDGKQAGVATIDYDTTGVSVADGAKFLNNETQKSAGGVLKVMNGMTVGSDVEFSGNKATNDGWGGGALYVKLANGEELSENGTVSFGDNAKFSGNSASLGGAIALEHGNLELGNGATFDGNTATTGSHQSGGAIAMWQDAKDHGDIKSTLTATNAIFKNNTAGNVGGAISVGENAGTANVGGLFESNSANNGGAIYNADTVTIATGSQFNTNTVTGQGGAIFNSGNLSVGDNTIFSENSAAQGGAISNLDGTVEMGNGIQFKGNTALNAGAISNVGTSAGSASLTLGDNVLFEGNKVDAYAGAILSQNANLKIGDNAQFIGNESGDLNGGNSGGAIAMDSNQATGQSTAIIGDNGVFDGNISTKSAGAIYVYESNGADIAFKVGNNATFTNNQAAANGGAIGVYGAGGTIDGAEGFLIGSNATFSGNTAQKDGGAIYVSDFGGKSATLSVGADANFENNTAANGGAIYNAGDMTIGGGAVFAGNTATTYGGAIANEGTLTIAGTADAMVEFNNNKAAQGSAIQTGLRLKSGVLNLDYTSFSGNEGDYQGAIANFHEMTITNSVFNGNKVTAEIADDGFNNHLLATSVDGGGAIYAGSASTNSISSSIFTNNTVTTDGGAIATRVDWKNPSGSVDGSENDYAAENTNAVLKIETSTFDNNTAGLSGGAIYNTFRQTSVADSTFTNNTAKNGGAIANEALATVSFTGTNTFTGNTATEAGGAILNKGEMTFNGNTVFANNTAKGVANDIHNTGDLTFNGDVSFTGGVTGDGTIAFNGDTLDIGSSIIQASSISIKDGSTLRANLLSGTAGFDAAELSGNNLNLVFDQGSIGGSLVFTQGNGSDLTFTENNLFDLVVQEDGTLLVDRKATDKVVDQFVSAGVADPITATGIATIVEATPTTPQAQVIASTIVDLAQSADIADQQKAAELTKATQPTRAPIRQAVTVNTQVIKTASDRLAQLRQGRSGGDLADAKLSPWVRGLFSKNHNSQGDGFDAYTHGFAFGVDAQVTEDVLLGAGYARSATTVKEDLRRTHVNGDNYFVYGKYQPSKWYVESILNYGHNKAKSESLGLSADYSIDTYGAQLFSGYQYGIADNYAGIRYVYVNPDDYDNGLNRVEGKSSQVATAVIGTRIAKEFQYKDNLVFKPEFRLAGTYDFKSDNSTANVSVIGGNTVYSVEGERLHRAALETGVGLTAKYGKMEVSAGYDVEWRVSNFAQTGMLKLKYNF